LLRLETHGEASRDAKCNILCRGKFADALDPSGKNVRQQQNDKKVLPLPEVARLDP
jgi:hypothetical protein